MHEGNWAVAGGTALGSSHADAGMGCQDSVAWWAAPASSSNGIAIVAAVADGAGSAPRSEDGSRTAVAAVVRLAMLMGGVREPEDDRDRELLKAATKERDRLSAEPDEGSEARSEDELEAIALTRALFFGARSAVESVADDLHAPLGNLATTLIVALVTNHAVVVAEIGDGVVAVRKRSGDLLGPLSPQRGEFANETTFITSGDSLPPLALAVFPAADVDAFALSSDGLRLLITSNPLEGTPHAPFFDDVFGSVAAGLSSEAVERFLEGADDRTGDDLSLLIGVRLS